ncbi:DNA polymerase [Acidithiobacillus ferriphilus]|uniref:DNA polymerase n=1 Tax=Acidithiobacillus ferriphilus TaxID=1689834 RepID=UPI001C075005|nr:DNA polymerase [Acidithiobacillus ferriphilus]MBU2853007.1 hypothetical protein [Acidithiobacillus ferriphilus]
MSDLDWLVELTTTLAKEAQAKRAGISDPQTTEAAQVLLADKAASADTTGPAAIIPPVPQAATTLQRLCSPLPNGFLTRCPDAVEAAIRSAEFIAIDLETTHLTKYSTPKTITGSTKIGGKTSISKILGRGKTHLCDTQPRIRVVSIGLPSGEKLAWDLDKMTPAGRATLLSTCAAVPVWVGTNLGFDLTFFHSAGYPAEPFLLDAMLVVRTLKPSYLHYIATCAALTGNLDDEQRVIKQQCRDYLQNLANKHKNSTVSFNLETLALAYSAHTQQVIPVDKAWQKPENWMLPDLESESHGYCVSDITLPASIICDALLPAGSTAVGDAVRILQEHSLYPALSSAAVVLAKMHAKGLPVDLPAVDARIKAEQARVSEAVASLKSKGLFTASLDDLADTSKTENSDIKAALADYCTDCLGITLELGADGRVCVGEDALILSGVAKDPAISAILDIREAKKRLGMLDSWVKLSASDGRLHGLVTQTAGTGRTTSSEPNTQQFPHAPEYRAVFRAKEGYKIIATDYSAVEMRIAAELGLRALLEFRAGHTLPAYTRDGSGEEMLSAIHRFASEFVLLDSMPAYQRPDSGSDWDGRQIHEAAWYYSRILKSGIDSRLAEGFASGIDPHLLTAVGVTGYAEEKDALLYLQSLTPDEAKALKTELKDARTSAKSLNFGLLYGMQAGTLHSYGITDYGLGWTVEEAIRQREAWLALYPEIGFWHSWSKLVYRRWPTVPYCSIGYIADKEDPSRTFLGIKKPSRKAVYVPTTLTNRPLYVSTGQQLLNFQDQGTGADIALKAIASLDWLTPYLVAFVHDEIVLEVPAALAEEAMEALEKVMVEAASGILTSVPCEVETAIGDVWIH